MRAEPTLAAGAIRPYDIFDVNANAGKARLSGRGYPPLQPPKASRIRGRDLRFCLANKNLRKNSR